MMMITKEEILNLIQIARNSLVYSYCPYSHFPVACALLCHDDTIYTGKIDHDNNFLKIDYYLFISHRM